MTTQVLESLDAVRRQLDDLAERRLSSDLNADERRAYDKLCARESACLPGVSAWTAMGTG